MATVIVPGAGLCQPPAKSFCALAFSLLNDRFQAVGMLLLITAMPQPLFLLAAP